MTARLFTELVNGVMAEGWDDAEKRRCVSEICRIEWGAVIPEEVSAEYPVADTDADDPQPMVASLTDYFGVRHLAMSEEDEREFRELHS